MTEQANSEMRRTIRVMVMGHGDALEYLQSMFGLQTTLPPFPQVYKDEFTARQILDLHLLHQPYFLETLLALPPQDLSMERIGNIYSAGRKGIRAGGWFVGPNKFFLTNLMICNLLSNWSSGAETLVPWGEQQNMEFFEILTKRPAAKFPIFKDSAEDLVQITETLFGFGGYVVAGEQVRLSGKGENVGTMVIYGTGRAEYLNGPGVIAGYLEAEDFRRLSYLAGNILLEPVTSLLVDLVDVLKEINQCSDLEKQGLVGLYGFFMDHVLRVALGLTTAIHAGKYHGLTSELQHVTAHDLTVLRENGLDLYAGMSRLKAEGRSLLGKFAASQAAAAEGVAPSEPT